MASSAAGVSNTWINAKFSSPSSNDLGSNFIPKTSIAFKKGSTSTTINNNKTIKCSLQTLHFPKQYQPPSTTTTTPKTATPAKENSPSENKTLPKRWNFLQKAAASA